MSINGVLEDVALADLLQFIHLGRRTGTLYMWQDEDRRAEIIFHDGRIVNAWTPGHKKLGALLVEEGLVSDQELNGALEHQREAGQGQTIGQILLDRNVVERNDIYRVFREQVEAKIFELVTWRRGRFHFEVDELHPVDEIGMSPEDLLGNLDLNTQMVLLEATRLFDERQRQDGGVRIEKPLSTLDRRLRLAGFGTGAEGGDESSPEGGAAPASSGTATGTPADEPGAFPTLEAISCQVVSEDVDLMRALREGLPSELARVVSVRLREAGTRMPGEKVPPIVLLDLRDDHHAGEIATLARTRPSASVVAVVESADQVAEALGAGAVSAAIPGDGSVVACCRNLIRVFSHPQPQGTFGSRGRGGFSRFRQVVFDAQAGLLSATMALNLMHVISESVERAVLFMTQGEELRAMGAFDFSADGEPLASLTSGLRVTPAPGSVLRRALKEAEPQSLSFEDAELPAELVELLGPPANGQAVVFPVLGAEHPISVIYTDNGELEEEIQDIKILELATSQVSVAFENELLRQQMEGSELDPMIDEPVLD